MRKSGRKTWWQAVPCRTKKSSQTELRMDINQILKAKLETIKEESELFEDHTSKNSHRWSLMKRDKRFYMKLTLMGAGKYSFKDSYLLFISGFVSKRCLGSLPHC